MTPEIYFARKLASNEKKIRDRSLKKLKRWIAARSAIPEAFSEDELFKLWKGLFYCMWMQDKPLIQEDLAETIASLVYSVSDRPLALKFISVALRTMARDWPGIDTWRMDKFMMFIRRIIRHSLEYLAEGGWNEEEVSVYSNMLSDCIINANKSTANLQVPVGLQLHIINLFPEELAKAGGEDLSPQTVLKMLEPFAKCLAVSQDFRLKKEINQHIFTYLIKQSDLGIAYEEAEEEKGNPFRDIDARKREMKEKKMNESKEEIEDEEPAVEEAPAAAGEQEPASEEEDIDDEPDEDEPEMEESSPDWAAKDPRAGGVDVVLPQLKPDYQQLSDMLMKMASDKSVRSKNRKSIYHLVKWFRDLASGIYPLAIDLPVIGQGLTPKAMKKAAERFIHEELECAEKRRVQKLEVKKAKKVEGAAKRKLEELAANQEDDDPEEEDDADSDDEGDDDVESEEEAGDDEDSLDEEEEEEEDDDVDEELSSEEEVPVSKKLVKATKKVPSKSTIALATFEVEDNWEDAESASHSSPSAMQQLKRKLKDNKRPLNSGWKESPSKSEVEIVVPNKKYKGTDKLSTPQATSEKSRKTETSSDRNRRVNFVLAKNTSQEPKDYQESLRKSPGVPHDPDRQPSGGGVLKRGSLVHSAKVATDVSPSPSAINSKKRKRITARSARLFSRT